MTKCKDCLAAGATNNRPTPHPGPRCTTCHRARRKAVSARAHANRIGSTYGLTSGQYQALYEAQGGRCAICQRATGATRRLAVDHDHAMARDVCGHDPKMGCPQCVRGLVDSVCNSMLAHARDDPNMFGRAITYLVHPPARKVLP